MKYFGKLMECNLYGGVQTHYYALFIDAYYASLHFTEHYHTTTLTHHHTTLYSPHIIPMPLLQNFKNIFHLNPSMNKEYLQMIEQVCSLFQK